jgi:hypothetical protein
MEKFSKVLESVRVVRVTLCKSAFAMQLLHPAGGSALQTI